MKQGNRYLKVIMLVLAFMVSSYILYNIARSMASGVPTTQAVLFSAAESLHTEGFVVRQETVLPADYEIILPTKDEGEKVARGAQVALSLRSARAQERQSRILTLKAQLEQLTLAVQYQSQLTDNAAVTAKIDEAAADLAAYVASGRLDAAGVTAQSLKSLVLRQELGTDDTEALQEQIASLERELSQLQSSAEGESVSVTVDRSGYYSQVTDGYETVLTPETVENMSIDRFQTLWDSKEGPDRPGRSAGRLIESSQWYYVTAADRTSLEGLHMGETLLVQMRGDAPQELEMTVSRLELSGEDRGLLVLSCDRRLGDVSALRRLEATVVLHSYSGVRVPKEAVCYSEEDQSAGVYILENGKAMWKNVSLIYDVGDAYIARLDQTSTENLWPGDLILPETRGLYDGKVVE